MNQGSAPDIILSTLNARYIHASLGLRYIRANLGDLKSKSEVVEFTISTPIAEIVSRLLARMPKIIGFGVYIWNTVQTEQVIQAIKQQAPEILIIIGGPEVTYEAEKQSITQIADLVLPGEADDQFRRICSRYLNGESVESLRTSVKRGELPNVETLILPYGEYSEDDIKNRVIYVEASRGCPFRCEYCLSSLDLKVRNLPLEALLNEFRTLIRRGARQFKFVDRTFNLNPTIGCQILKFFLEHIELGLFLHFEMVPDRLPEELKTLIAQFPKGSLQFEIGLQTLSDQVSKTISRRQDLKKVAENFKFLREHTQVHTHADLIVGLPGETLESFGLGFNQLLAWGPDEIQVGILKRLNGAPIDRHTITHQMVYDGMPPYTIQSTGVMTSEQINSMARFSKFWDHLANSGRHPDLMNLLTITPVFQDNFFNSFLKLTEGLYRKLGRTHSLHPDLIRNTALDLLVEQFDLKTEDVAEFYKYSIHIKRAQSPSPTSGINSRPLQKLAKRQNRRLAT